MATRVHLVRQTGPIGVYESRCAFGTEVSHVNRKLGKWTMINDGMYIVEILRGGEDLLYEMDEMNRWMGSARPRA